ncbi:hypothetical protein E3U55_10145 [Filobacillus milosensis]|uniref:Uncharacterized protein n=1 Tax=Filobacillus milosensis TaxID=94137 RepID=A0A4Y8IIW2_9BACI|nr:hypothetical protein [Filobacillus milosensis]TFB19516.1 hypothetical protein E3U55_10145 [Filobacillus milosensis]
MAKKKHFEKWGRIREKDKKHFIIYYGVLGWGLSTAILVFFIGEIADHGLTFADYFTGEWIKSLLIAFMSFMLGGVVFGYMMWGVYENNYHDKYINTNRER